MCWFFISQLEENLLGIKLVGFGMYLPEKVATNEDFEKIVETSDEWIVKRTGIKKRHMSQGEFTFQMGVKAATRALESAGITAEDINLIIVTTVTADFYFPSMANVIQGVIGAKNAIGIDISCACAGFVYGLDMAQRYIDTDENIRTVLIVSSENMTKTIDYSDRGTAVLFGDGAGAVVVKKGPNKAYSYLGADAEKRELIYAHLYPPSNCFTDEKEALKNSKSFPNETGRFMYMNGPLVYQIASSTMVDALNKACEKANVLPKELDIIIPHQANIRIIETAIKKLGVQKEKVYVNIEQIGNISSACIPVCLAELLKAKKLKTGCKVGVVGFGAGMIYAAMVFTI